MAEVVRRCIVGVTVVALGLGAAACSASHDESTGGTSKATHVSTPTPTPTPLSLDGTWKQSNSKSSESWQTATISGDAIEVDWVTDSGATTSLYWAGSVAVPTTNDGRFTWDSTNDTSKTEGALLASNDPTKTFTYDHGVISYSVSALGTTTTVELAPQK